MTFEAHPKVVEAVRVAKDLKDKKTHFSDIIDENGNQFVDIVMEGGGVLGIALAGYTYVLEHAGIRFRHIAGTSAGSITALLLASLNSPSEEKSKKLVDILSHMPLNGFIDGDSDAQDFVETIVEKAKMVKILWKGMQIMDNLKDDLGLCKGAAFESWLTDELGKVGVKSVDDLNKKMSKVSLKVRDTRTYTGTLPTMGRLAMVAADVTCRVKVEFPKMAELYFDNPNSINPAKFARASMSIPFIFQPARAEKCPDNLELWKKHGHHIKKCPDNVIFMDGGIMSNFPINMFHTPSMVPLAPTFGVKIGVDEQIIEIDSPGKLLSAVFNAARGDLDADFILQNPDYKHLVKEIDTGEHNWLNFNLTLDEQVDLFARGAEAASQFLTGFNWSKYKEIRGSLAEAYQKVSTN
jgi:NTE family protein